MTLEQLQEIFGKEPATIYIYDGIVDDEPTVEITEAFATAAGTNLVDCVVSQFDSTWFVYTRNTVVEDDLFRLVITLPLPEPELPEIIEPIITEETAPDAS